MHKYLANETGDSATGEQSRLKLGSNEQLLASYPTMLPWQALLWVAVLFGSSGSLLGLVIVIALIAPGGEGLRLYDRVLRLVLEVNGLLFGRHSVHLTSQRLALELPGQAVHSIALGSITGTETRTFRLGGNLFVHAGGATARRLGLWVVRCGAVAEQIRAVCQQRGRVRHE